MKYFYCDSCFIITCYQDGKLGILSQYKNLFYISETQIVGELFKPNELSTVVRQSVTVISTDRDEIIDKTNEFYSMYETLSLFDCLCMAYSFLDGYCLITDDKSLIKKCAIHNIQTKTSKQISCEFNLGGENYDYLK